MSEGNTIPHETVRRLWPRVTTSPELHFHSLDVNRQAGLFIYMAEGAYRDASFLDGRTFTPQTVGGWIPLQRITETVLRAPPPAAPLHFIFHMGHTGSTLLSRLLDETGVVQPLREPLVLRQWAELYDRRGEAASLSSPEEIDVFMEVMLRLWGRCRENGESAIVKATSSAARVGGPLMTSRETARAVYLSMAPEAYLTAILAAPGSLLDMRGHAEERMRRLTAHLGSVAKPLFALGTGELVAASWLTEALTRESLKNTVGKRLLSLDFDEVLGNLPAALERVLKHLALPGGSEHVGRILSSPILGQYAKAPEHAYSKELRSRIMEQSRHDHRAEIVEGMAFLSDLAKRHTAVGALLQ